jgi:hypothetical protein
VRSAGETIRQRVCENMPPNASAALKSDIEAGHKRKVKPVEIIKAGRKMEELF